MNELSNFEVLELLYFIESTMGTLFETWLTITFTAIAASFLAGSRLTKNFAHFITAIYLFTIGMLVSRWLVEFFRLTTLFGEHPYLYAELFPSWAPFQGLSLLSTFLLGTGGCVFCIYHFRKQT